MMNRSNVEGSMTSHEARLDHEFPDRKSKQNQYSVSAAESAHLVQSFYCIACSAFNQIPQLKAAHSSAHIADALGTQQTISSAHRPKRTTVGRGQSVGDSLWERHAGSPSYVAHSNLSSCQVYSR
jgi:hypothetical protein